MYKIILVNGKPGSGKTTFANLSKKVIDAYSYSSIDFIKEVARDCGWDGISKTEKDRKFLSDLKELTTEYSDLSRKKVIDFANRFVEFHKNSKSNRHVLLIDVREPVDLDYLKNALGAETLLVSNPRAKDITSNMADANVLNYDYDYVILNHGTIEEFEDNIALLYYEELDWCN